MFSRIVPLHMSRPLFDAGLIVMDAFCATQTEAIHEAVRLLNVSGRTQMPDEIEQAIWCREAASSTALGHGFAIPHCRSGAVGTDSVVVLKLRTPVEWGPPGSPPVRFIFLMVVRETSSADAHLKTLAQLGRKLTDEMFRTRITDANDAAALCRLLESVEA